MLSEYDARQLEGLERELRKQAPALVRRIESFDRGRVWLRLAAAAVGIVAGLAFILAGVGWSTGLFGFALITVSSLEITRRSLQLLDDAPAGQRPGYRR
ncbi:MAG TPA: DUF3040 domain-containing protein [Pseudonocardia sp.]|jgi:hypothetical protein